MNQNETIDVIGAGVEGLFSALALVESGVVVRIHATEVAHPTASRAAGGILSPLYPWRYSAPISRLTAWSQRHYFEFLPLLARETGIDAELESSGLLILGEAEAEMMGWAKAFDVELQLLKAHEIAAVEQRVQNQSDAIWLPRIGQVRSPRLLHALRIYLETVGVSIYEGVEITGFNTWGDRLTGLRTSTGIIDTERCIVAAGAWAGQLLRGTGIELPVQPVRGQMIAFKTPPGFLKRIVMKDGVYAIPRRDGLVVVGSTLEHVGFTQETTPTAAAELATAVASFLPELSAYNVTHHWAGLRPSSPHDIPFIGEHPNIKGLYINAGHYRNGVVMAPASAQLLADIILNREPIIDPSPYALPAPV